MKAFLTFLIMAVAQLTVAAAPAERISVGVAQLDITPSYPVRLSGFGFRRTESEGVTLKIWAKAMAIVDEKDGPAVIVTVDNLCVPDEITSEIARRLAPKIGLKRERLTITATHTHTAPMLHNVCPTLFGVPIPPEHQTNIDRYTREFTDSLEQVALAAFKDVRPAELLWGVGKAGFAVNRRTKGGPVDHDLPTLVVRDPDGKIRAVYFSYACHCVTLSDNKISGDWSGYAQKRVEEYFPGAIALASVGCGADSNPASGVTGDKAAVCDDQGKQIADEVKRIVSESLTPITAKPEIRYARIDLPLAEPRTRAEWEERAKRTDAVGHHARVNLARLDRGESLPTKLNYPVQSWIFGDQLAMVFLPGETVVDYSLRLKREYDRTRLWINGYSNDGRCYIPSERVLKEGGYEGGDAMIYYDAPQVFATGLEEKIIATVRAQIPAAFKVSPGTEGVAPLTPEKARGAFRIKPGLKVELVAAEPLVQSPVAIDWGADGKLWVCEMADYPAGMDGNWKPGGRVKFLRDDNGDGSYDGATLFLDQLPFPTGVTAWGRGVLICAAPDIIYAEDTNGDGKADKVEKLFTGFPTDNYQARVNSLSLGLDNWIYGANGLLGGNIEPVATSFFKRAKGPFNIRNHDFRFNPIEGAFEVVSGLTQQGRVRDDWGNWYGCNNSELLLGFWPPDNYIRRNPDVPAPPPSRSFAARPDANLLFPTSRLLERFNDPGQANRVTSGCGLGIYRDTLLGDEFYGNAFTCEPVHNLVHREVIDGRASHRASDEQNSEFLSSTDNWFRPVQARTGPDGALYIVDMYRFLIEHPRWIPADRLAKLDVRAGADKGRIYRVVRDGVAPRLMPDLTKLKGPQLAEAVDSANGTERDRAHTELLLRRDRSAVPALKSLVREAALPQVRVQALSALDAVGSLEIDTIKNALLDPDEHVREHAVRFSEGQLSKLRDAVLALTNDNSIIVARQVAFTLGESTDKKAGEGLATLAKKWPNDADMRTAILSSAKPHAEGLLAAIPDRNAEFTSALMTTVIGSGDKQAIARSFKTILSSAKSTPSVLAKTLEALDRKNVSLDAVLPSGSADRRQFDEAIAGIAKLAGEAAASESDRVVAISLLGRGKSPEQLTLLCGLARDASDVIRKAAVTSLKRQRGSDVAEILLRDWPTTSPAARAQITALLLDREEWSIALLNAVKAGVVRPHEISPGDRQRLAESSKEEIRKLASEVLPAKSSSGREEVVAQFKPALTLTGSAEKGADVFSKNCATCHQLSGVGAAVGPDLGALRNKDAEYWLKNILDPNAVIEPRYIAYNLELKDDRSLSGVIRSESANSLTLVSGGGIVENISRGDIRDIRASALSLMPEGLEQVVDPQGMANLIAYLRSGAARKVVAGNEPKPIAANAEGMMLPAAKAEIYGDQITFEQEFGNIGMWHGADDHVVWTISSHDGGTFDVYLDYASAASASGNKFVMTVGEQTLRGAIATTGPDWSHYKQAHVGQIKVAGGIQRVIFRPEGNVQSALIDLRAVALVSPGKKPQWPQAKKDDSEVLRDPVSVARFILDPTKSNAAREAAVQANPQFAAALITEMTRDLRTDSKQEYDRIPWIWRVAIACGKRNDTAQIAAILDASLPKPAEPLRDWQAVVIGGGIINGLSQRDVWPGDRVEEILKANKSLKARWSRALELAGAMTENTSVPTGTRYDALRMIAMESWEKSGRQLTGYLAKGTNAELQMGAVSGLADMKSPEATAALLAAMKNLGPENRKLAVAGLLRDKERIAAALQAIQKGALAQDSFNAEQIAALKNYPDAELRDRAALVFR